MAFLTPRKIEAEVVERMLVRYVAASRLQLEVMNDDNVLINSVIQYVI